MTRAMKKVIFGLCILAAIVSISYVAWGLIPRPTTLYIVVPTYNNEEWCLKNLDSVIQQAYPHWKMIIINDASTDHTSQLLHDAVTQHNIAHKVTIIDNKQRVGACRNIYDALHGNNDIKVHAIPECPDNYVICILDGDDWYATPQSLARVAQEYQDPSVWMTYGNYQCWPNEVASWCAPLVPRIVKERLFRKVRWFTAHHRTYYAWLLKRIKKEDLMYNGEFLQATCDMAFSFPALEMASGGNHLCGHIRFIPQPIYIYNIATAANDYKVRFDLQEQMHRYIRNLPSYQPLD